MAVLATLYGPPAGAGGGSSSSLTPPATIDSTGLTTSVPLLIKNGKQLSGVELQVTGTAATGFMLRDSAGTLKAALGYAVSTSDWFTGASALTTIFWSADAMQIRSSSVSGIAIKSSGGAGIISTNDSSGTNVSYSGNGITCDTNRSTIVGPIAVSASTSLAAVALQIAGDPNTGIGAVGGADTLSVVAGGVEQVRVSTTLMTVNGKLSIPTAQTQTTIGANGGASALTVLPVGYIKVDINGSAMIVPYYNA